MSQRLFCTAPGLWMPGQVRRILRHAGLDPIPAIGWMRPGPENLVGAWGQSPLAAGAEALADASGARLIRIEDAFLRGIAPGRARRRGDGPLGLMIDHGGGIHFDPSRASALEQLLATDPLDDAVLLQRARDGLARIAQARLSKYNTHDPSLEAPPPGYVLVVDQTRGDASVLASGAGQGLFREMLFRAQDSHPGARIVIRSHPETAAGLRQGHFGPEDQREGITLLSDPVAPQVLLEGAIAVYTVSSQLGFEAILAGHRPRVFGRPFYAGWGLTEDDSGQPLPRRGRRLTKVQMFAAAMILAPTWFDACRDRLCSFEEALDQLEAEVAAFRQDRSGHVATGMRLWKRGALQAFFGRETPVRFVDPPERALQIARDTGRGLLIWAGREPEGLASRAAGHPVWRVEDGLIRSRGLGAELVAPLSLMVDGTGIYYDPSRESAMERAIAQPLRADQRTRAERLVDRLLAGGVTKYSHGAAAPAVPEGHRILVPGQVEDDASIRLGATGPCTNLALLERVRAENPDAIILWKPHPDVEAGLRAGKVAQDVAARLADVTLSNVDPHSAIALADEVWTMTSTLGFEALLRGVPVTCLGTPFYAGWGLTRDLGLVPARRQARPDRLALAHAALIATPRYHDPISRRPCPPEVVVERIAGARALPGSAMLRHLARLQGLLASQSWLWRR